MTNDELQALANKVTSDEDVSNDEQIQFLEETDKVLKEIVSEIENASSPENSKDGESQDLTGSSLSAQVEESVV